MKKYKKETDKIIIITIVIMYLILNSIFKTSLFSVNFANANYFSFKNNFNKYQVPPTSIAKRIIITKANKPKSITIVKTASAENLEITQAKPETIIEEPKILEKRKKTIALSFDDGPSNSVTPKILDILKEQEVTATFFVLGSRINNHANIIRRIKDEGHEIGNHGYNHTSFKRLSGEALLNQINNTNTNIINIISEQPTLVRPPYGELNKNAINTLNYPIIFWSIDPRDWDGTSISAMQKNIITNLDDGKIILLHDLYENTAQLVKIIVPQIKALDYDIVSITELFNLNDIELKPHQTYYQITNNKEFTLD